MEIGTKPSIWDDMARASVVSEEDNSICADLLQFIVPALSTYGGQAPLPPASNNQLPWSFTHALSSLSLPQSAPIVDEVPSTLIFVEVDGEDVSPRIDGIVPTDFSAAGLSDESSTAIGNCSRYHFGTARKCWNAITSAYNRLALATFRKNVLARHTGHFSKGTNGLVQLVNGKILYIRNYCISVGLCRDSILGQGHRDERYTSRGGESQLLNGEADKEHILPIVPGYVLEYAPYVHLYSGEQYWPCDIAKHLLHTTPYLNYTPAQAESDHEELSNLDHLNKWGRYVYLTSDDDVEEHPEWLLGKSNIPESRPQCKLGTNVTDGSDNDDSPISCGHRKKGHSDAPAILIVVEKDDGVVDAFWFFFYSFNKGNTVLNVRFGNHIGDWEHTTVRFVNGEPTAVFLSEHNFGDSYTYNAMEKKGKRVSREKGFAKLSYADVKLQPVVYSAVGSHAMYAVPGSHPYVLPFGLLHDITDRGPIWDPSLNLQAFSYNITSKTISPTDVSPFAATAWFDFVGRWGDKHYPLDDPRQYTFAGYYHYGSGPLGPKSKRLSNEHICEHEGNCVVRTSLDGEVGRIRFQEGWREREDEESDFMEEDYNDENRSVEAVGMDPEPEEPEL